MLISCFHQIIPSEVFGMSKSYIYCFWCCPIISNSFQPHGLGPPGSPGFSVHGILQARTLEWVANSFSGGASPPRYQNPISCVSCIGRHILPTSATWEALYCFCCLSIISCMCVCVCVFKLWIIFYWMKSTRISRVYAGHVGYKDVNISFQAISSYEMSSLLSSLNSC